MTTVNTLTAKENIVVALKAGVVPMLTGSPGCGKSDIIKEVAEELGLYVIDHRLSTSDPTDLTGMPTIVDGEGKFLPFNLFPIESTPIPEGYNGFLLFLDEMNSAPISVQAAAYKLVLDRQVGQHNLHPRCVCVAAGNLSTDGAIVNDLGTAMQSRMVHLELEVNSDLWLDWAHSAGVDSRVTSFINYAPEKLHMFDPNHNDKTFACPRTWSFMSRILKVIGNDLSYSNLPILEGTVGAVSREFLSFCDLEKDLPTLEEIIKDPKNAEVPKEPGTQYFVCGVLSNKADESNVAKLMQYIERLPIEFQLVSIKDMIRRNNKMRKNLIVSEWIKANSKELFSNN